MGPAGTFANVLTWLPNAITVLRIALIPGWWIQAKLCVEMAESGEDATTHRMVAVAVLAAIGVSDVVDGFLARRFGSVTRLGAILDAVADKLVQLVLVLFLTFAGGDFFERVPLPFLAVVLGRDLLLAGGSLCVRARRGSVAVVHSLHGKLASFSLFLLLLALTAGAPRSWIEHGWWIVGTLVVGSTIAYVRDGWRQWSETPDPESSYSASPSTPLEGDDPRA